MKQSEMFDGADFGSPNFVSLKRARDLVADVEDLANVVDETWPDRIMSVAEKARRMGAFSVERVVWWLFNPCTLDRHGYDAMHFRAEDVAHRWLRRQEMKR